MRQPLTSLFSQIENLPDRTALIGSNSQRLTFAELAKFSDAISENIKPRAIVFCLCHNSIESVAGYVGFMRKNAVPVLLGVTLNQALLARLITTYCPEYLFLPLNYPLECVGNNAGEWVFKGNEYGVIKTLFAKPSQVHDQLSLLLSTSGTTGSPKLVRLSSKNLSTNSASIIKYLNIQCRDRAITTLPMQYSYGLSIINTHLIVGSSIVLTDATLIQSEFWELVKNHSPTMFGGVPYSFEMLKKLHFTKLNTPSIRTITQAGGPLAKDLVTEFSQVCNHKGIQFFSMYGQTEATARMSYVPPNKMPEKAGTIGMPIPGGEFWLENDQGKRVTNDFEEGELVYRGENVSLGYAENRSHLQLGDNNNGILRTGDIAQRDSEGFYTITGRKSRFLKVYGNRVNLAELEALLKHNGLECLCAGSDDNVKIYTTSQCPFEEILKMITEKTGLHFRAFSIKKIKSIPRSDTGKVLYSLLDSNEGESLNVLSDKVA